MRISTNQETKSKKMVQKLFIVAALMSAMTLGACKSKYVGIDVNPDKYVKLGQYTGVEATVNVQPVTDEIVEENMNSIFAGFTENVEVTDRDVVQKGDVVIMDYLGSVDGVAFEGGTAKDTELEIGGGTTIPGFEDGVIGHKIGETFVTPVTFPEDYHNADLVGKAAEFEMKVSKIMEKKPAEVDDEYIKNMGYGFNNREEMVAYFKDYLQKAYDDEVKKAVWDVVNKNCTADTTPTEMDDFNYDMLMEEAQNYASKNYNMTLEDYYAQLGYTKETFEQETRTQAQTLTKETLICYAIAQKEGFSITAEEISAYADENAQKYGYQTGADFLEFYGEGSVERYLMTTKVQLYLVENAVIINSDNAGADATN